VLAFAIGVALGFSSSVPALALAITTAALRNERKRALLLALSGALAESIWAAIALVGIGQLLLANPDSLTALRLVGAVAIVLLGASLLRSSVARSAEGAVEQAGKSEFLVGFLIVAANPGFLLTWTGLASLLVGADGVPYSPRWALVAGACLGIVAWFMTLFALVARFRTLLSQRWLERAVRGLALLVIALGVALAVSAVVTGN
jgi:threonine/homoserine/homoserine lactone efflux protein